MVNQDNYEFMSKKVLRFLEDWAIENYGDMERSAMPMQMISAQFSRRINRFMAFEDFIKRMEYDETINVKRVGIKQNNLEWGNKKPRNSFRSSMARTVLPTQLMVKVWQFGERVDWEYERQIRLKTPIDGELDYSFLKPEKQEANKI